MSERTKEPSDFFAFVPSQIEAQNKYGPLLTGFPLNILFAGITNDVQTGQQSLISVCYVPAPETFREDSQRKEMCYFTKPKNGYFIRVIFEKAQADGGRKSSRARNSSRRALAPERIFPK